MRTLFAGITAITLLVGLSAVPLAAQEHTSIWSGVFTDAQAARGEATFVGVCARCHLEDLSGKNGPPLKGAAFVEKWREASLDILFSMVKSMPPNTPRNPTPRLPDSASLDVLTHLLKANGAPAGSRELTIDALPSIQFEKQTGAEAVPNLTLVRVVGCVSQPSPGAWALTVAGEPVRVMNPDAFSAGEVSTATPGATPGAAGTNTYTLSQVDYIDTPIARYEHHAVAIKGTLVRQDRGGTRINLTAIATLPGTCE